MTTRSEPQPASAYPGLTMLPDPPEDDEDTQQQRPHVARIDQTLRGYYHHVLGRDDVLVGGEGYLCREASEARQSPRPDCIVALGVPIPPDVIETEGNGYAISEIGQPPDFVLEVASETTARRDETVKREQYARLEVQEYWRFDGSGKGHYQSPLAGDVLLDGEYVPIPVARDADGMYRGYSVSLGLELHVAERQLRFWNPAAREYLPDLIEALQRIAEERAARRLAEARVRQLEAEVRRLQGG